MSTWRNVYLADHAGEAVADRFLSQADVSFSDLAEQKLIGVSLALSNPALTSLRKWRVNGFDNHLIFYLRAPTV